MSARQRAASAARDRGVRQVTRVTWWVAGAAALATTVTGAALAGQVPGHAVLSRVSNSLHDPGESSDDQRQVQAPSQPPVTSNQPPVTTSSGS